MRIDARLRIAAARTWLPGTVERTAEAVAAGALSERDAADSDYVELPVSTTLAAPQLAALAATAALEDARLPAGDVGFLAHAWTHHQGHAFWSPAHFVADAVGAHRAEPVGVQQMCNGGAAALGAAANRLLADPHTRSAVVTTGDCFARPGFDRWRGDYGVLYGDAGTAAVLTGGEAARGLHLLSLTTTAAPELERMHRGDDPLTLVGAGDGPVDVRRVKKAFLARSGKETFGRTVAARVEEVLTAGLADAGVPPAQPHLVLLPRLGTAGLDQIYRPAVAAVLPAPAMDLGHRTGHLGAGDLLANLADLTGDELLPPGGVAAVLSAGAGFTWSCVVVRRPRDEERNET